MYKELNHDWKALQTDFTLVNANEEKQSPLHLIDFKVSLFNLNHIYVLQ